MKFSDYNISSDIKDNLNKLGFIRPTDIQFKAIPPILRGEDVLAVAQTGTGKTAAFAIPIIDKIHQYKTSKRSTGIKCIVMVPTRELALQIGDVFAALSRHTKVVTFTLHGGVEQESQIKKLQDGIDILIATPGRMFDLINQKALKLEKVSTLVLDEADHMLDLGFIDDIKYVKKMLTSKHQTLFFSATINPDIKKLAFSQVKTSAIRIQVSPDDPVSRNVTHYVMFVEMDDKRLYLEKFINDHPESKIMVFVRTKVRAERVAKAMERVSISTLTIHSEKDQSERTAVMTAFKSNKVRILIATDISARGIDIPNVHFVVNYDLPEKVENYVHRVGRTGRGVSKGSALSFCSSEERPLLGEIEQFLTKKIEVIKTDRSEVLPEVADQTKKPTLEELVAEHEAWLHRKKKKRSRT
ncbi:MAG TPA: DEAD/DEAH box helicase [Chitinispirillaceae bacterium]|nr:DEAD/DEAH box helicase [Chitinispirillaceae bacterium]